MGGPKNMNPLKFSLFFCFLAFSKRKYTKNYKENTSRGNVKLLAAYLKLKWKPKIIRQVYLFSKKMLLSLYFGSGNKLRLPDCEEALKYVYKH